MRKIVRIAIALSLLLTGCSAQAQTPEPSAESGYAAYGVYEFTFEVEQIHGGPAADWDFIYTYNGETISDGEQLLFPQGVFSFRSIQTEVSEKDAPENRYSITFPVAVCDGGSGKAEITVTDSDGQTAVFRIHCFVLAGEMP